jgi:NAD(P)-dependent dehydrogenase (short-subunit alcohol dehydrogenase family)
MAEERFATYPSLAGRPVLITGGASGIGRAFVETFAAQGARVAFLDISEDEGRTLEHAVARAFPSSTPLFIPCDVSDTAALTAAVAQASQALGGLKVLVANAANDSRHTLEELTPEAFDRCIAVNLKHQLFAAKAAAPHMAAAGGGSVICLGSISWLNNTTGMIAYTTAKAGIHGMVRTLARLLGPQRIRVNALLPGWTMTERQLALWVDEEALAEIARAQCLPDKVEPDDVARMALFLAADDSAMATQQMFVIDGGWI